MISLNPLDSVSARFNLWPFLYSNKYKKKIYGDKDQNDTICIFPIIRQCYYYNLYTEILNNNFLKKNCRTLTGQNVTFFTAKRSEKYFYLAAQCSGVFPAQSGWLTGILFKRHSWTNATFPRIAASWSGLETPPLVASSNMLLGTSPSTPLHLKKQNRDLYKNKTFIFLFFSKVKLCLNSERKHVPLF